MELTDIFEVDEKQPKEKKPKGKKPPASSPPIEMETAKPEKTETTEAGIPSVVLERVKVAVSAHDAATVILAAYTREAAHAQKEMDQKLASVKAQRDCALTALGEAKTSLMEAMEQAGVSKLPMTDRPDIKIKVTPGGKKQITKGWLIDKYGEEEAKKIWDAVPKHPDKKDVVIPDPFTDEPEGD